MMADRAQNTYYITTIHLSKRVDRFDLPTIHLIHSGSIFEPEKELVSGPLGGGGQEARLLDRDRWPEASSCSPPNCFLTI